MSDANGQLSGGIIVCRDITETKKEELFRSDQSRVLEMIAANASVPEVLTKLVLLLEAQADGLLCSILVLTRNGLRVRHGAAPSLPKAYVEAVNDAPIGPRQVPAAPRGQTFYVYKDASKGIAFVGREAEY